MQGSTAPSWRRLPARVRRRSKNRQGETARGLEDPRVDCFRRKRIERDVSGRASTTHVSWFARECDVEAERDAAPRSRVAALDLARTGIAASRRAVGGHAWALSPYATILSSVSEGSAKACSIESSMRWRLTFTNRGRGDRADDSSGLDAEHARRQSRGARRITRRERTTPRMDTRPATSAAGTSSDSRVASVCAPPRHSSSTRAADFLAFLELRTVLIPATERMNVV